MGTSAPQVILGMVFVKAGYQMEIAGCPLLLLQLCKHMPSTALESYLPLTLAKEMPLQQK